MVDDLGIAPFNELVPIAAFPIIKSPSCLQAEIILFDPVSKPLKRLLSAGKIGKETKINE